jgi:hypothetical protein
MSFLAVCTQQFRYTMHVNRAAGTPHPERLNSIRVLNNVQLELVDLLQYVNGKTNAIERNLRPDVASKAISEASVLT